MSMEHLHLEETASTNSWLREHAAGCGSPLMVTAACQTAGRGQRGNTWESEPGRNLTFSVYYEPEGMHPRDQFRLSEAVALAIADVLGVYGIEACVKWPNDIYVGNMKICGILIENSLMGASVSHSIIGAGLNVNQREFVSDAPNPVSMSLLTGREYDLEEVRLAVAESFECRLGMLGRGEYDRLHADYMSCLWRREGRHPYTDRRTGEVIEAEIAAIGGDGMLTLCLASGELRTYAFKEVVPLGMRN